MQKEEIKEEDVPKNIDKDEKKYDVDEIIQKLLEYKGDEPNKEV